MEENNNIELRSSEVQDILTKHPHWLVRSGLGLILLVVTILVSISFFIKYPDVIVGEITVTTEIPPITIVNKQNGIIEQLLVKNNSFVKENDPLLEIENTTSANSVEQIKLIIKHVDSALKTEGDIQISGYKTIEYGMSQDECNNLFNHVFTYNNYKKQSIYKKQASYLKDQIQHNKSLRKLTESQVSLTKKEFNIAQEMFVADKKLYEKNYLSKNELNEKQNQLNSKNKELFSQKQQLLQYSLAETQLKKQLVELKFSHKNKLEESINAIETSLLTLGNFCKEWNNGYVLNAPATGKLVFLENIHVKQHVDANEKLFALIDESQPFSGIIEIGSQGLGKVEVNQTVWIKLNNYPSAEFGKLKGIVKEISILPNENKYRVKVIISSLTTTYNKNINAIPNMIGTAEIITKDLSLADRFLGKVKSVFDR